MSDIVTASDGTQLDLGNLEQAFGYDGSGNCTTITIHYQGKTFVQTLTWTAGNMTDITGFIKQ